MPRPVQCDLCGRDFFEGSIDIHRRQCEEKQKYLPTACRYCDAEVRRCDMAQHLKRCEEAKKAPKLPRARITRRTSFGGTPTDELSEQNGDPSDHRVPCAVCGRKFNSDRLAKHQGICRKISGNKAGPPPRATPSSSPPPATYNEIPRNKNEVTCDLCGRQFFKSSIEIHRKQCLAKQPYIPTACPYCDAEVQTRDLEQHIRKCEKAPPPSVRRAARREAAEAALGMSGSASNSHLVPCAVCGRTFAKDRLAKHQGICRKISNNEGSVCSKNSRASPPQSSPTRSTYSTPVRNPNEVDCDLCGRPFFKTSIAIHRKQCLEKQPFIPTACPYCDAEVMTKDLEAHVKRCDKKPPGVDRPTHRMAAEATLGLPSSDSRAVSPMNDVSPGVAGNGGSSHLVPCAVCGRTFVSDRLAKHQSICRKNDEKAKARASGVR